MRNRLNSVDFIGRTQIDFVSVVIPVFKNNIGLRNTLISLRQQSMNKDNFEIIVVNDGGCRNIEMLCRDFKVFCFSINPRRGSYNARNIGLKHSKGEYLAFIDAGTIADRQWLRSGMIALKKDEYVGGPVQIIKPPNKKISDILFVYQKATSFDVEEYMTKLHFAPTTNLFVRREVIERLGGFDQRLKSGGDWEFGDRVRNSGLFSQKYIRDVRVYHYARSYESLTRKIERVSRAQGNLIKLYPQRFKTVRGKILFAVVKAIFSPFSLLSKPSMSSLNFLEKIKLIFIAYYFKLVSVFHYIYKLE